MEIYFTEQQAPGLRFACQVRRVLAEGASQYQRLAVLETTAFGRMLVLDGVIQTTEKDEFVYHEMIAHVPLMCHPRCERVLIIGGGDGGTMREVLRHPQVQEVHLVEIDQQVVDAARQHLPTLSSAMSDPRARIIITDGIEHVKQYHNFYDLVIIDSTDPIGPAVGLFSVEFYASVERALRQDGLCVAQTESPFFNETLVPKLYQRIQANFPLTHLYLATVPTYPGGMWSFTLGSKTLDPRQPVKPCLPGMKYYSPAVHQAAFVLPPFVEQLLNPETT